MAEAKGFKELTEGVVSFDFKALYAEISYKGFDANQVADESVAQLGVNGTISIAMLGVLRGTNVVKLGPLQVVTKLGKKSITELVRSRVILEKKTGVSPRELTIGRIAAACAPHAAYGLMKSGVKGRVPDCNLPGYCQFPGLLALGFDMTDGPTATEVNKVLDFYSRAFGSARRPELEAAISAGALMNLYKMPGLVDLYNAITSAGFAMKKVV